jgi:hypothetical protein
MKDAKVALNVFLRSLMVVGTDREILCFFFFIINPNKDGFQSHIILYGGEMKTSITERFFQERSKPSYFVDQLHKIEDARGFALPELNESLGNT